ncbi:hyperosmotically inducible protein [Paraburkholderia sp. WC7.3g]|uniref:BON domain-containing protein n=1 Tax=Paraburkholderia sp. WC7.3g TaxID=2991070 RepID=UPI003D247C1E
MRNAPYLKSRLLIVAAFALPAFVFINGCKSTETPSVTAPGEIAADDAALAARVKQALVADPGLRSLPMSVATYRGVVQLSGYVDSEVQIQKALAVTRGVPGCDGNVLQHALDQGIEGNPAAWAIALIGAS